MKLKVENDEWELIGNFHDTHPQMKKSLEKYLNALDALFRKAKEKQECEFILSLLAIKGMQSAGWDLLGGMEETFKALGKIRNKNRKNYYGVQTIYLFMYGLILESDPLYELLANLLNVAEGKRFLIAGANFPDIKHPNGATQSVPPIDKINQIKSRAEQLKLNLSLFDDFYDKELRNALFHSDYVLYDNEIRLPNTFHNKVYSNEEWVVLTNNAMAYYQAITHLRKYHISLYDKPQTITPHPEMVHRQNEKVLTIVREGHGVIGIKDAFTKQEIEQGKIPFSLGKFYPEEQRLIRKGQLLLPKYKEPIINIIYKYSPDFFKRILLKYYRSNQ